MISHDTMIQKKRTSHLQNWRWNLTIGIPHMLRRLFPPCRPFGSRRGIAAGMQNTGWSRWVHPMVFFWAAWNTASFVSLCLMNLDGDEELLLLMILTEFFLSVGILTMDPRIDSKFSPSCIELFVRAVEGRYGQMVILSYSRGNMKHCPSWLPDDWVIWMFLVFFLNLAYERVYF